MRLCLTNTEEIYLPSLKEKCLEMKTSIAEKGYYITKSTNRKMTKLGVHNSMDKARAKATIS